MEWTKRYGPDNEVCRRLAIRLTLLVTHAQNIKSAPDCKALDDAKVWFFVDELEVWKELDGLRLDLFDDRQMPANDRWSGRLRRLLVYLRSTLQSLAPEEAVPAAWFHWASQLAPFVNQLVAMASGPVPAGNAPTAAAELPAGRQSVNERIAGIDKTDAAILRCLSESSPVRVSQEELANYAKVCQRTIGLHIKKLAERGLVRRTGGWFLTDEGARVAASLLR